MRTRICCALVLCQALVSLTAFGITPGENRVLSQTTPVFSVRTMEPLSVVPQLQFFAAADRSVSVKIPPLRGLAVSGQVTLDGDLSYARVIAITDQGQRLLVWETDELTGVGQVSFAGHCVETCALDQDTNVVMLEIQAAEVTDLTINRVAYLPAGKSLTGDARQVRLDQQAQIVEKLNRSIQDRHDYWVAGPTQVSLLSFAEREKLFGGRVPALGGFLYYKGGYFPFPGGKIEKDLPPAQPRSGTIRSFTFDWRNRHGQNWMTPVGAQMGCWDGTHIIWDLGYSECIALGYDYRTCGSCWAFSATGPVEAMINLYYNQHIDADLSEQDLVSCGPGSCSGGMPYRAMDQITNVGVVDEDCFPSVLADVPCSDKCADWATRAWKTGNRISINSRDFEVKKALLYNGPLSFVYWHWNHAMTLAGFGEIEPGYYWPNPGNYIPEGDPLIGTTYWLAKNSYGPDWGREGDGYGKFITTPSAPFSNFLAVGLPPIPPNTVSGLSVLCTDSDADGYCWWGLGPRPSQCPASCATTRGADFNDASSAVGPFNVSVVCGNHPYRPSGESTPFGDYLSLGMMGCCGDNLGEYPVGNLCCDNPTDLVTGNSACLPVGIEE